MPITLQNTTIIGITGPLNAVNFTLNGSQVYARSNILSSVSQSAGVPTGGLIESANNSNGQYVRFANGMQLCYFRLTSGTSQPDGGLYYWNFPAAFSTTNGLTVSNSNGAGYADYMTKSAQELSTTRVTCFYRPHGIYTSGFTLDWQLYAIGRWY